MAKVTVNLGLTWAETGGDTIKGTITETTTQAGTKALGNVQTIGATSEQILLGDVTGAKFLMFENRNTTAGLFIYIDTANPATTSSAIKLGPGQGHFAATTEDAWYAISSSGSQDLGVTAVQQ